MVEQFLNDFNCSKLFTLRGWVLRDCFSDTLSFQARCVWSVCTGFIRCVFLCKLQSQCPVSPPPLLCLQGVPDPTNRRDPVMLGTDWGPTATWGPAQQMTHVCDLETSGR